MTRSEEQELLELTR